MKERSRARIVVIYNRDYEGAEADPENKAREDIQEIAGDVLRILRKNDYEAEELGVTHEVAEAMQSIRKFQPDAVFNLCESIYGDNRFESLMPLLLEMSKIPFTGSGAFALSLALRKEKVKEILRGNNVTTPWGCLITRLADCDGIPPRFPVIVKPAREDASVGISCQSVVKTRDEMLARIEFVLHQYRQPVLVEEYIAGREIYVSLLGNPDGSTQIFPFFEIDFSDLPKGLPQIVSFEGKWVENSPEYRGTKPIRCTTLSPEISDRVSKTAHAAFRAVGIRDYARVDIRLSVDSIPHVIDVNPNCDLSDLAGGFSKAARAAGLTYQELILHIAELALSRRSDGVQSKL